jgi:hypothetical protein
MDYWCADLATDGDGGGCGQCGYTCPDDTPECDNGACAQCPIGFYAVEDDSAPYGYDCVQDGLRD